MVDPFFVNDSLTYKGITFLTMPGRALTPVQKGYACAVPGVVLEPILELQSLVNNFIGRTMNNLHLVCHFVIEHPPVMN
jgi:hypothetical protein